MRRLPSIVLFLLAGSLPALAGPNLSDDWASRVKEAKFGLIEAIDRGQKAAGEGVMYAAELEVDNGVLVYSLDIAQGAKLRNVVLDAKAGSVVDNILEDQDKARTVSAFKKIGLKEGVEAAIKESPGTPFYAFLLLRGDVPAIIVALVDPTGRVKVVSVDGVNGTATVRDANVAQAESDREFTDRFLEDKADFTHTGRNTYFILEPGWFWVFEGTEGGQSMAVTYTTLDKTRMIDGVECRAVEAREIKGGVLKEITMDYYAISKKTANVYYFGETVDEYKDGKVVGHAGTWLAGEGGCRWGLMVPAVPLVGERHYQEIAPGIARDRVETMSTTEVVETPAGKFENVLKQEETNPEEVGHLDYKFYAPGVGMVKEEANLVLVKFGKK